MIETLINSVKKKFAFPGEEIRQLENINKLPRYRPGEFNLYSSTVKFPDAASFVSMYKELFHNEIYKFGIAGNYPFIIDCGANIGLSVIYFKHLYPHSEIIAFEPDPAIFDYLSQNVLSFKLENIELRNTGLWKENTEIEFYSEGADSGKIIKNEKEINRNGLRRIKVEKLSKYIDKEVDFLKIDIEGAETELIQEIKNHLFWVKNIFIEYHSFTNRPQDLDTILKILTENNFRYYIYSSWKMRKHPFAEQVTYHSMDCLLNICATRQEK